MDEETQLYLEQLAREAFKEFDNNNTGTIDQKELTAVLRCMGQNPTDSEVNDMINEVDVEGTGIIEFEEFVRFAVRLFCRQGDEDQEAKELFRRFDSERKGVIPVEEIKFVMKNLPVKVSEEEIDAMIEAVDEDGNGTVDIEEFKMMIGFGFC